MISRQSSLKNECTYTRLAKLLEERNLSSVPLSALIDELEEPEIDLDYPQLCIESLLAEWRSLKGLLKQVLLDRVQLAKENHALCSYFFKPAQLSDIDVPTRDSGEDSEVEFSPQTVRQTLMDTYEFNLLLGEEGCSPVSVTSDCSKRTSISKPPHGLRATKVSLIDRIQFPSHRKRSSSFGSFVMEEETVQNRHVACIEPRIFKRCN